MSEMRNISTMPTSRKPICFSPKPWNLVCSVADLISSTLMTEISITRMRSIQSKSRKEEKRRMR